MIFGSCSPPGLVQQSPSSLSGGSASAGGALIPTALLLNGHFGAMLVARLIVPLFPHNAHDLFPVLSYIALATALYVAVRALTENSPRRLIAYLALSQSACILAGLESRTVEGVTGALVHWYVVTASTMGLFAVLRLLEVRFGENLTAGNHLGVAGHAPRLAVFFIVFGFALLGLPGTLRLLFSRPSYSWNSGVTPANRTLTARCHSDECGHCFSFVRAVIPGKTKNGFHDHPNATIVRWAAEAETVEQAFYAPSHESAVRLHSSFRLTDE
jgi:hypothetical protein